MWKSWLTVSLCDANVIVLLAPHDFRVERLDGFRDRNQHRQRLLDQAKPHDLSRRGCSAPSHQPSACIRPAASISLSRNAS